MIELKPQYFLITDYQILLAAMLCHQTLALVSVLWFLTPDGRLDVRGDRNVGTGM